MRQLELADLAADGAGERAALVAEELALENVRRDRAAVDRQEALVAPRAREMQRVGDQLLAGAALADDEHRRLGRRHQAHLLEEHLHLRRAADDALEPETLVELLVELDDLLLELALLELREDALAELVEVDRLGQVVVGADPHRLDGGLDRAEAGDQDDREVEPALADLVQEAEAVEPRHAQVADRELRGVGLLQQLERPAGVVEGAHDESGALDGQGHRLARAGFIINHKDLRLLRHGVPFWHKLGPNPSRSRSVPEQEKAAGKEKKAAPRAWSGPSIPAGSSRRRSGSESESSQPRKERPQHPLPSLSS